MRMPMRHMSCGAAAMQPARTGMHVGAGTRVLGDAACMGRGGVGLTWGSRVEIRRRWGCGVGMAVRGWSGVG